jgi:6-phosphofructokinase 1
MVKCSRELKGTLDGYAHLLSSSRNLLYLQGGGPTCVINETAYGVHTEVLSDRKHELLKFNKVLAARHGIEGVLKDDFIDMDSLDMAAVSRTPSAAFGTSRMELHRQPMYMVDKFFDILKCNKITHVITNGGGDTAETALTIHREAEKRNIRIRVVHAPKTIDNDLPNTDHSPGFGTAAYYVANTAVGTYLDAKACKHIHIDVAMGRTSGWLTASSILARDAGIKGPHLIYVGEHNASLDDILTGIESAHSKYGFAHVVISESYGGKFLGCENTELSTDFGLEIFLAGAIKAKFGCNARIDKYGYPQRCSPLAYSERDKRDAFMVGKMAVRYVLKSEKPVMVSIKRTSNNPCVTDYVPIDLELVATPGKKQMKLMPQEYIGSPGVINDSYRDYVRPLCDPIKKVVDL